MPHVHAPTGRRLGLSIILTLAFVVGEAVAGYYANSLGLLSDAAHNFADALALIFSWYAVRMARRPADARRTFGYHRVGVLAALANAVGLIVIAVLIFWEAAQRLRSSEPVEGGLMIAVAFVAVLLNGLITFWLRDEARHDLNIRSAYLHMLGDALAALGVVIAGVIVVTTGQTIADPVVSLLIGVLILWSSWDILMEAVNVLLEAVPKGLDMGRLVEAIRGVPGVRDIHDLHAWTISSGMAACSCHILVDEQSARESQQVQRAVAELLEHDFRVTHSTIQVEVECCLETDLHCTMRPASETHEGHQHG